MEKDKLSGAIEAMLFVSGDGVTVEELAAILEATQADVSIAAGELASQYAAAAGRGLCLRQLEDKLILETKPAFAREVEAILIAPKQYTLSQAALETLSIVAYQQPVTRGEIERIRGVQCSYVVHMLQKNGLIEETGRRDTLGRPVEFGVTQEFLRIFGLSSRNQLPPLPGQPEESGEEQAI